jgi:hypothetical protein
MPVHFELLTVPSPGGISGCSVCDAASFEDAAVAATDARVSITCPLAPSLFTPRCKQNNRHPLPAACTHRPRARLPLVVWAWDFGMRFFYRGLPAPALNGFRSAICDCLSVINVDATNNVGLELRKAAGASASAADNIGKSPMDYAICDGQAIVTAALLNSLSRKESSSQGVDACAVCGIQEGLLACTCRTVRPLACAREPRSPAAHSS